MREENFLERIPEYVYPFPHFLNGERIFFKDSYDAVLHACYERWGSTLTQVYCTELIVWREFLHVLGGSLVAYTLHLVRSRYGGKVALAGTALFVAYILFQELIVHPRELEQVLFKSLFDIAAWLTPVLLYWSLLIKRCTASHFKKG